MDSNRKEDLSQSHKAERGLMMTYRVFYSRFNSHLGLRHMNGILLINCFGSVHGGWYRAGMETDGLKLVQQFGQECGLGSGGSRWVGGGGERETGKLLHTVERSIGLVILEIMKGCPNRNAQ